VLSLVQENSNAAAGLDTKAYLDFLGFWATHGPSARSVCAIVQQLAREAVDDQQSWRRAVLLDKIQFDIFSHYWRRLKPDFASFFINSTAHFQHAYFHLMRPESFGGLPARADDPVHKDAVLFGYQEMDKLLARFFELEKQGALLVLSTALSQGPNQRAGHAYYRPRDIDGLLAEFGVRPARLLPVMAQQYSAEFLDQASADAARDTLRSMLYRGEQLFDIPAEQQPLTLFFGTGLHAEVPPDAVVEFADGSARTALFGDLFYRISHTKSGAHRPESVLWFKTGRFAADGETVSILDILPTLLDYYGVEPPQEEAMPRTGASFLPKLEVPRYARALA
jgi:hypothetical protein